MKVKRGKEDDSFVFKQVWHDLEKSVAMHYLESTDDMRYHLNDCATDSDVK